MVLSELLLLLLILLTHHHSHLAHHRILHSHTSHHILLSHVHLRHTWLLHTHAHLWLHVHLALTTCSDIVLPSLYLLVSDNLFHVKIEILELIVVEITVVPKHGQYI